MNSKLNNIDLREFIFIIRKNFKFIIAFTLIVCLLSFLASKFVIHPKYQAEATFIVNASTSSQNIAETYDAVQVSQMLVDTYAVILKSNTVLEKVKQDLNLDMTVEQLRNAINVQGVGTTQVLNITVKDKSPEEAEKIGNELLKIAPSEIIRTVKAGSVEIISSAKSDGKPVSPNVAVYSAIGLLAGALISLVICFVKEMLDNSFESDDDIEKYLEISIVGVIPALDD